ncbi:beta-1,4-galactosyltransferase 6 isoform X2 [Heterodontus francisci]|uniref:beta-1,4-galactosyltransferase 6 isoform X2 n=1 Tax=Heterodontus francisci TaxID=7792 RepID=UPI00355C7DCC
MLKKVLRISNRSFFAFIFFFSLSTSCLYFIYVAPGIANTYLFMMQAQGKMLRDNVRTIGILIRDRYTKRNSTLNSTDYLEGYNSSEYLGQSGTYLPEDFTYSPGLPCPEKLPSMKGFIDVNMSEIDMAEIQRLFSQDLEIQYGGHWKPKDCKPRWKAGNYPFNRAMLFNVGFMEAMKDLDWDCVVFHDVDHIPESDRNYYGCGQMPRHFASKLDKYMYLLPYNEFFGGVSGLTVEQFRKINGFPNAFWGWGGEDDDLWRRVSFAGYNVTRPEGDLGKYKSIPHHHRGEVQFLGRYKLLRYSKERQPLDGLNNLKYTPNITLHFLYKNVTVNLTPELAPVVED